MLKSHQGRGASSSKFKPVLNLPSGVLNYEEYLSQNYAKIEKPLANLLVFPSDDVQIVEIEKKFSTIEQLRPEHEFVLLKRELNLKLVSLIDLKIIALKMIRLLMTVYAASTPTTNVSSKSTFALRDLFSNGFTCDDFKAGFQILQPVSSK